MKDIKNALTKAKKIAILYDIDSDGLCSSAIVYHTLNDLGTNIVLTSPATPKLSESVLKLVENSDADLIITTDLSIDVNKEKIENSSKKWLVIDHHQISNDLNKLDNATHMNPILEGNNEYYPASKYAYDLLKNAFGELVEKYDWLACVGLIGDSAYNIYKEFVKNILKKYSYMHNRDPYLTKFGELDRIVSSGRLYKGMDGAVAIFEKLKNSSSIKEFEKSAEEQIRWSEKVSSEIEEELKWIDSSEEIIMHKLKSKFNIGSPVCGIVANKHKSKTVVVYYEREGMIKVHFRRIDGKIDLSKIARNLAEEFSNAAGGGHPQASGGHVPVKYWNEYRERLIKYLEQSQ